MREWSNPWNSFNSMKVLMWREWLEGCARLDFLPPVTVDTDPSNRCNFDCIWCNAFDYMGGKKYDIPEDHLLRLADFYEEWGIHSTCVAGGGEPLINPGTKKFLIALKERKIEVGVITNGSLMNDSYIDVLARTCRWVGISMDAATPKTYIKVKGIKSLSMFDTVVENIRKLCIRVKELKTTCDVCYKYLLHPVNAGEIYQAAKLAKSIGVKDFHMRPAGWDNLTKTATKGTLDFKPLIESVDIQVDKALVLEDGFFNFYGIRHKFNPDMTKKVNFSRCWAAPLIVTFGADGNCHLCFDLRGRKDLILCNHYPEPREILRHWNTDRHKKMLRDIDIDKCPRCTFGVYNEIVENVFIKDGMSRYFP